MDTEIRRPASYTSPIRLDEYIVNSFRKLRITLTSIINVTATEQNVSISRENFLLMPGNKLPEIAHINKKEAGLKRAINDENYRTYRRLFAYMMSVFNQYNITYFLSDGTLLGSYFYHDILPWDDDVDMRVMYSDYPKLKKVIYRNPSIRKHVGIAGWGDGKKVNEYSSAEIDKIYPDSMGKKKLYHRHKWFFNNQTKTFDHPWRWPFIDIFFLKEKGKEVFTLDVGAFTFRFKKTDVFPLHLRPFLGLWVPAPRDTNLFLKRKYRSFECKTHGYNHTIEKWSNVFVSKPCNSLTSDYPYVKRKNHDNGTIEQLVLNRTILYEALVDEKYTGKEKEFSLA